MKTGSRVIKPPSSFVTSEFNSNSPRAVDEITCLDQLLPFTSVASATQVTSLSSRSFRDRITATPLWLVRQLLHYSTVATNSQRCCCVGKRSASMLLFTSVLKDLRCVVANCPTNSLQTVPSIAPRQSSYSVSVTGEESD